MTKIYKAILTNGQTKSLYAINSSEALRNLGQGMKVKSIKLDLLATLMANYGSQKLFMSLNEAQSFSEQMSLFLPVMPDFVTAVQMSMSRMTDRKASARRLRAIQKSLNAGERQAAAIEAAGFPKEFVGFLKIAEDNSSLPEAFGRLSVVLLERRDLFRSMIKALVTPALTLTLLVVSFVFMLLELYPRLTDLFQQASFGAKGSNQDFSIRLDMYLTNNRYMIVTTVLLAFGLFVASLFVSTTRAMFVSWLFKIPFFRDLVLTLRVTKFCMAIEMPLTSGLTTLASLERVVETASLTDRKIYNRVRLAVESGQTLKDALFKTGFFPGDFTEWIGSVEKSGTLSTQITSVRDTYEKILKQKFDTLKTIIEPVMLLFGGLVVLVMAGALYAPVLSLIQNFMSQS